MRPALSRRRVMLLTGCHALALLLAGGALAQRADGGALDGGPSAQDGCGELTHLGRCDGDTLVFCQAGQERQVDCAAEGLACVEGSPSEGFVCAQPALEEGCACVEAAPEAPASALASLALVGLVGRAARRRRRPGAP